MAKDIFESLKEITDKDTGSVWKPILYICTICEKERPFKGREEYAEHRRKCRAKFKKVFLSV